MPIHKDLPDSELHPPKGFTPAPIESFPIKNSSGFLEWISTSNLGSKWHTGSGTPAAALGRTGDFYLDSDVGDFYEKVTFNTWTLRGNVDGSDWFKGSGPPSSSLGRVQDFYIDIDEGDLYEKTAPTAWGLITNIDGSDWFQGAGPPASSLGRVQDFYIDKVSGDLYEKTAPSVWTVFANITGPQGPVGPMANVSDDSTPELGGNLDGQGNSISNVSSYNGVVVEAHASRHAPGGSDAIATGTPATQTPDQVNTLGVATSLSKSDHVHNIPTAAAVGLDPNSSNTLGNNPSFARSNHTHAIASGNPVTQVPDQSNTSGTAASFAKSDHVHNIPSASAVGLDANSPNAQGSNPSFARSNHTHAVATGIPSTQTPGQTNAAGSSPNLARADHIHNIPTAVPQNIGAANSEGSANSFSRSDHVHNIFPVLEGQQASIETAQTTTGGLAAGLTLTTTALVGGSYKIEWYYEWGFNDAAADYLGRIQVDNTTNLLDQVQEPKSAGGAGPGGTSQRQPASGFAIINLTAGIHFIDLDFGSGNGALATLWRARLSIRRWS